MVEILGVPVYDPVGVFVFIFLPGFLALCVLKLTYPEESSSFFKKVKIFDERLDAVIWSILAGLCIVIIVSLMFSLFSILTDDDMLKYNPDKRSAIIGITSLSFVIYFLISERIFTMMEESKSLKKEIILWGLLIGLPVISIIGLGNYLLDPNPLIQNCDKVIPYNTVICNSNFSVRLNDTIYVNYTKINLLDAAIVNPADYPLVVYVSDGICSKPLLQLVNGSYEHLGNVMIVEGKDAVKFNAIIGDYKGVEKRRMYVVTNRDTIPIKCECE